MYPDDIFLDELAMRNIDGKARNGFTQIEAAIEAKA